MDSQSSLLPGLWARVPFTSCPSSCPVQWRPSSQAPSSRDRWLFWEDTAQGCEAPLTRTETALVVSNRGCNTGLVTGRAGGEEGRAQAASDRQEPGCEGHGVLSTQASPWKLPEAPRDRQGRSWSPRRGGGTPSPAPPERLQELDVQPAGDPAPPSGGVWNCSSAVGQGRPRGHIAVRR